MVNSEQQTVVVRLNRPVAPALSLSGVWRLLCLPWIAWPGGGFVTVSVGSGEKLRHSLA